MILVEREMLEQKLETQKAAVLQAIGSMHQRKDFSTRQELVDFLEALIAEVHIATEGNGPNGLTRVLLFAHSRGVIGEVRDRMATGYVLRAYRTPDAWAYFGARLPELQAMVRQIDKPAGHSPQPEITASFIHQTSMLGRLRWLLTGKGL